MKQEAKRREPLEAPGPGALALECANGRDRFWLELDASARANEEQLYGRRCAASVVTMTCACKRKFDFVRFEKRPDGI
jgi:hypothetical protein